MPSLRPAVGADRSFLLGLTDRLASFPVPAWRTREEIAVADHGMLLSALAQSAATDLILVVEDPPGNPAGFLFASTRTDYFTGIPFAHVEILVVAPDAEGRGLARALMEGAEDWAGRLGYSQITLNVFAQNERARGLYERLGYAPELLRYRKGLSERSAPSSVS